MGKEKKRSILLIDDNEIIRIYFRDIFWIHGLEDKYDLTIVEDIKKAEEVIHDPKIKPDVVFSGLVMPMEKDGKMEITPEAGFSLLKMIKTDPKLQDICVVIFTGYDKEEYRKRAKELGADEFLVKHENLPHELVKFIENLKK